MKRKKVFIIIVVIVLLLLNIFQMIDRGCFSMMPDVIPDEETAISMGKVVIKSVYNKDFDDLTAIFDKRTQTWIVFSDLPEGMLGGIATVVMKKHNGQVVKISHTM